MADEGTRVARLDAPQLVHDAEVDDFDFARRLAFVITSSERHLGLPCNKEGPPVVERLGRIIERALAGGLDPELYRTCYLLRGGWTSQKCSGVAGAAPQLG